MTSTALNLALNHASSPNWPFRIGPRLKSLGKPHTADTKDASHRLLVLVSVHAVVLYDEDKPFHNARDRSLPVQ